MSYKNWTKWYKSTLNKNQKDNENDSMSERD